MVTSPEVLNSTDDTSPGGRIVGGWNAERGSAPWIARIIIHSPVGDYACGGSLIDQRWIVSAAHCFDRWTLRVEDVTVKLGDYDTTTFDPTEVELQIDLIYKHEHFDSVNFNNDIALIRLTIPLASYNDYIRPICLPNRTKDREIMVDGTIGRVNGWGSVVDRGLSSIYLQEVNIPFIPYLICKRSFRSRSISFTRNMFCAGYERGGADACQGDSGGPYSVDDNGRWYLTGIVSWGEGCGQSGRYGVYARYSKYHSWVQKTINIII